jgi:hypothetical protein
MNWQELIPRGDVGALIAALLVVGLHWTVIILYMVDMDRALKGKPPLGEPPWRGRA